METPEKPATGFEKHVIRYPLYTRIGFGLLVLFGLVGNCTGRREGSVIVFILTALVWVCSRIIQEAIDSIRLLQAIKAHEEASKEPEKKDPPAPPADPPASA